jgi:hypothetical protein
MKDQPQFLVFPVDPEESADTSLTPDLPLNGPAIDAVLTHTFKDVARGILTPPCMSYRRSQRRVGFVSVNVAVASVYEGSSGMQQPPARSASGVQSILRPRRPTAQTLKYLFVKHV